MQWAVYKYVLSKKLRADIFDKSAFTDRRLVIII